MIRLVGWTALAIVVLSAIPVGANRPVAWIALAILSFVFLAISLMLELRDPSARLARLWPSGVLVVLALAWGYAQTSPTLSQAIQSVAGRIAELGGWPAPTLIHPAWTTVDAPGTISADPIDGRHAALRLCTFVALFIVAVLSTRDAARAALMVRATGLALAAAATYGLVAFAMGSNPIVGEDTGASGLTSTFINRNSYATYAAFGMIINLTILLTRAPRGGRGARELRDVIEGFLSGGWIFTAAFVLCATALLATQSRAGVLAGALGALLVFVLSGRGGDRSRSGPAVVLILLVALTVFATSSAGLLGRLMATNTAEEGRGAVYLAILHAISERPIIGYGLGSFLDTFRALVPEGLGGGEWDKAHNTYLELIYELGVPAAAAFLLGIGLVMSRVLQGALEGSSDGRNLVVLAALGCTFTGAVHSLFDFSLQIPAIGALFAFLLGMGYSAVFKRVSRA